MWDLSTLRHSHTLSEDCAVQELDSASLVGPFQFNIFCYSVAPELALKHSFSYCLDCHRVYHTKKAPKLQEVYDFCGLSMISVLLAGLFSHHRMAEWLLVNWTVGQRSFFSHSHFLLGWDYQELMTKSSSGLESCTSEQLHF